MAVPATEPVPFGKYELITRLATGGMAEIFLARTKSIQGFEKYLVIKRILRSRTSDPEFVRMFLDEARLAATLDHPNIIQIYDVGHINDEYFIAMEYLRGHNIVEIVRAGAKLGYAKPPLEQVVSILSAVCGGLHYAHEKRDFQGRPLEIVHRDITPQNIVTSFEGAVKIVDFGIAKAATREVETLSGTLKGKIGYMSPEQCRGDTVDRRSDIFAVGIILYELTTGKRLYHERSDFETLKRIIEGPVPSPRDLLPFYPAGLNSIVVRCLQKHADERYQTARDLHSDLDTFARENQLVTGTVSLGQYMERVFAEELAANRTADAAGLVFTAAGSAGSHPSYLGESSRRSSGVERPLQQARRRHLITRFLQLAVVALVMAAGGAFWWWRTHAPATANAKVESPVVATTRPPATGTPGTTAPGSTAPGTPTVAGTPGTTAPGTPTVAGTPGVAAPGTPGVAPIPAATRPGLPSPGATTPRPIAHPADAHITVASAPRCEVLVDGAPYGATPLIDLAVPPGKHVIILLNSSAGIKHSVKVKLGTGQLWTKSFGFEGSKVNVQDGLSAKMLAAGEEKSEPKRESPAVRPKPVEGPVSTSTSPAVSTRTPEKAATPPATAPTPPAPAGPHNVAGFVLEAQKLSASMPHLPAQVMRENSGKKLNGTYKICVNKDGQVYDVQVIAPISGADSTIVQTLRTWSYKPQIGNVCALKALSFQVP